MVWHLLTTFSYPDYKRPWTATGLKHYAAKKECETERDRVYEAFLEDFDDRDEDFAKWRRTAEPEEIEERVHGMHFADAYMDMPAFQGEIGKVVLGQ